MDQEEVLRMLNELLNREQCSLALRLMESGVFVSSADVEAYSLVQRLARGATENAEALTNLILRLGGIPGPRYRDAHFADVHYLEARHLLPPLVKERRELVRLYEAGASRLGGEPAAAAVVTRILGGHRSGLESLNRAAQDPLSTTPA